MARILRVISGLVDIEIAPWLRGPPISRASWATTLEVPRPEETDAVGKKAISLAPPSEATLLEAPF